MAEEKKEEKKQEKKEVWEVGAVATETAPVVVNTKTGEQLDVHLAMAKILNTLEQLKQLL